MKYTSENGQCPTQYWYTFLYNSGHPSQHSDTHSYIHSNELNSEYQSGAVSSLRNWLIHYTNILSQIICYEHVIYKTLQKLVVIKQTYIYPSLSSTQTPYPHPAPAQLMPASGFTREPDGYLAVSTQVNGHC
jgi:hypothetical protein